MNPQARTRMLARADYLRATHRMTWGEVARAVGWVGPLWRRPGTTLGIAVRAWRKRQSGMS